MSAARALSLYFAAGALGGLAYGLAAWLLGELGVTRALGVALAPGLTAGWLYPRIVEGGLWGLLFVLPVSMDWWRRGLLLALAPAAFQLLVAFPVWRGQGLLGLELGLATPLVVLALAAVWGLVASFWVHGTRA